MQAMTLPSQQFGNLGPGLDSMLANVELDGSNENIFCRSPFQSAEIIQAFVRM